jgi:GxxExxY protein
MDIGALNERTGMIVDAAMEVHSVLGPGLLESAYQTCLAYELRERGLKVEREVVQHVRYKSVELEEAYRIDLIVDDEIVVETKTVSKFHPVHEAQLLSYLKLSDRRVGLLINFHVVRLKHGIRRKVNHL